MKKTINFFSMAALAMLGAMTVSCSSDNDEFLNEQPVNKKNLVTTTVTVGFDDATTRALTDEGVNTFAAGDKIVVFYKNSSNYSMRAESEALAAGDITNGGKTAKFTITLDDPKLGNSSGFRAVYPASMAKPSIAIVQDPSTDEFTVDYSKLATQDGTLATLGTQLNLATYNGWLKDGKVPSISLENRLNIAKFKIKGNGADYVTSDITGLTITEGTNSYAVTPSSLTEIYVAMKPVGTSTTITFDATTATKNYHRGIVTSKALSDGHITPISLAMYEYVTLDGVKWATVNIGATSPEGYGNYYAWGETTTKASYTWDNYFDTTDGGTTFTKYNSSKWTLDSEDDAAKAAWGGKWRIPTGQEWENFCNTSKFEYSWTEDYNGTGIGGKIITEKSTGKSIFLPAAGLYNGTDNTNVGIWTVYCANTISSVDNDKALTFSNNKFTSDAQPSETFTYRYQGRPVRAVLGD